MAICMQERGRVFVHLAASSGLALVICDPSGGGSNWFAHVISNPTLIRYVAFALLWSCTCLAWLPCCKRGRFTVELFSFRTEPLNCKKCLVGKEGEGEEGDGQTKKEFCSAEAQEMSSAGPASC